MRAFLLIPIVLAGQGCFSDCFPGEAEFALNDDITVIGLRPSEALAQIDESYTTNGVNHELETGDVQISIRSRPGDPVVRETEYVGRNSQQWCEASSLRMPVAVEITSWFGGVATLAGHRFFYDAEGPGPEWQPDITAFQLIESEGFGAPRNDAGDLVEGTEFWTDFRREASLEWLTISLFEQERGSKEVLRYERKIDETDEFGDR